MGDGVDVVASICRAYFGLGLKTPAFERVTIWWTGAEAGGGDAVDAVLGEAPGAGGVVAAADRGDVMAEGAGDVAAVERRAVDCGD